MSEDLREEAKRANERLEAGERKLGKYGPIIGVFLLGAAAGAIATMALMPADNRAIYDDAAGASDPRPN